VLAALDNLGLSRSELLGLLLKGGQSNEDQEEDKAGDKRRRRIELDDDQEFDTEDHEGT
jgi:hypothetical protein